MKLKREEAIQGGAEGVKSAERRGRLTQPGPDAYATSPNAGDGFRQVLVLPFAFFRLVRV